MNGTNHIVAHEMRRAAASYGWHHPANRNEGGMVIMFRRAIPVHVDKDTTLRAEVQHARYRNPMLAQRKIDALN